MKQNNQLVLVEDFNIDTLREAFQQGRLYIHLPEAANSREEGIQAILQYVSRIDTCVSDACQSTIRQLWEQVLRSPELGDLFFLNRYSSNRGKPNWYRVNAIVATLLELDVYRKEDYTALQLHLMMEQVQKRNNHYNGMNRYLLDRKEMSILLQMLKQVQHDKEASA